MERLPVGSSDPYDPIEASIHVGRYALAVPFAARRRILDVACGEGYGAYLLARAGAAEVVGVDVSEAAVEKARATFQHPNLRFVVGTGETLSELFPSGHFDMVVSIETIEHVADVDRFLREILTTCRPSPLIVMTCPNDYWYYGDRPGNPYHLRRLRFEEFKELTTSIVGDGVEWLLGGATFGFAAVPPRDLDGEAAEPSPFVHTTPSRLELRVPPGQDEVTELNCSYFVGVWNAPEPVRSAGASHACSMDAFARMAPALLGAPAGQTSHTAMLNVEAMRQETAVMAESIARLQTELQLARGVAPDGAAITDEYFVLVRHLRERAETAEAMLVQAREARERAESEAAELRGALEAERARVAYFHAESPWRMARRLGGRALRAYPPLFAWADRLRR
jgi:SAM-dependent methyltransferase